MQPPADRNASRRLFLQFLAASPLLARAPATYAGDESSVPMPNPSDPMLWAPPQKSGI